jgi:hypothetical protein
MKSSAYYESLAKVGLVKKQVASPREASEYSKLEDSQLPEGVYRSITADFEVTYFKCNAPDLSEDELQTCLQAMSAHRLKIIMRCVIFFTVIAIISLILSLINFLL